MRSKSWLGLLVVLVLVSMVLGGCAKTEEQKVMDAVQRYADAMNKEDVNAVQDAMHRDNWSYFYIKQQLPQYFSLYNVKVEFEDLKFIEIKDGIASVSFVMTTRKTDNSDFKDTRIKGTFTLKQEDGVWKLLDTVYDPEKDVEFLTPQP